MKLETKFKIGDTIYTVEKCKIREIVVSHITVFVKSEKVDVMYREEDYSATSISEEMAFPSREALIDHIQNS